MLTPEGAVKAKVKKLLASKDAYFHMPVTNGMGAPSLDFICCHKGQFFAVETKAKGTTVTLRQQYTIDCIRRAGGLAFVVSSTHGLEELRTWLERDEDGNRT